MVIKKQAHYRCLLFTVTSQTLTLICSECFWRDLLKTSNFPSVIDQAQWNSLTRSSSVEWDYGSGNLTQLWDASLFISDFLKSVFNLQFDDQKIILRWLVLGLLTGQWSANGSLTLPRLNDYLVLSNFFGANNFALCKQNKNICGRQTNKWKLRKYQTSIQDKKQQQERSNAKNGAQCPLLELLFGLIF